jgi:hypothetical protein
MNKQTKISEQNAQCHDLDGSGWTGTAPLFDYPMAGMSLSVPSF